MRFTVRRLMVAVAVVALMLGAGVSFLKWCFDPSITVVVLNETGQPLNDVRVFWSGGARNSKRIGPGGVATWRINPYGSFAINLSYRNSKNLEIKKYLELYHDIGYRDYIEFHASMGEVRVVERFGPYR